LIRLDSKEPVDGRHRWAGVWDTINSMKLTHLVTAIILAFFVSALGGSELVETFRNPPEATKPWCYWYFLIVEAMQMGVLSFLQVTQDPNNQ
jgi:hypothetical protein